jgi:hypothetical protein
VSARRRTVIAVILVWCVMVTAAVLAAHWTVLLVLLCTPAAVGVLFVGALMVASVCAMHPRRGRRPAGDPEDSNQPLQVPARPPLIPPRRRRGRPPRAHPPPRPPLTGAAAARVDQELMRVRAEAGDQAPDHDDFIELMRGAGAGDLEGITGKEPDDQDSDQ